MRLLLLALLWSVFAVQAGQITPDDLEAVPEPPELPDPVASGEAIEPDVTIIQREDETIEEYRINGNLYMVKITPTVGKPYFLLDRDGDGQLESQVNDLYNDISVPQWVLFSWD